MVQEIPNQLNHLADMTHSEFECATVVGRAGAWIPRYSGPLRETNWGNRPTGLFFVFRRWMGAFRPLFPEAEEGLLAAEEDAVVGQGKAGAVATHG